MRKKIKINGHCAAYPAWLFCILMLFSACGPQQEAGHMQSRVDGALNDLDRDRHAVRLELIELRRDLDMRILGTEEELRNEQMAPATRTEKEDLLRELQHQRNRVQQALLEVEDADEGSWRDVRERSRSTTKQIDAWFDRQAELEDLKAHDHRFRGHSA